MSVMGIIPFAPVHTLGMETCMEQHFNCIVSILEITVIFGDINQKFLEDMWTYTWLTSFNKLHPTFIRHFSRATKSTAQMLSLQKILLLLHSIRPILELQRKESQR